MGAPGQRDAVDVLKQLTGATVASVTCVMEWQDNAVDGEPVVKTTTFKAEACVSREKKWRCYESPFFVNVIDAINDVIKQTMKDDLADPQARLLTRFDFK